MGQIKTENLKRLRKERKLTQEAVAKAVGMGRTGYLRIEKGTQDVDTEVLSKMADFFGVPIDYLLGRNSYLQSSIDEGKAALKNMDLSSATDPQEAVELYKIFKQMPPEMQKTALAQLRALADMNKK